ncbi:MAG: hypothetical protein PHF64_04560 [Methanoregula sp.]|nr:hypothetical protein [Methanoregula sp.]
MVDPLARKPVGHASRSTIASLVFANGMIPPVQVYGGEIFVISGNLSVLCPVAGEYFVGLYRGYEPITWKKNLLMAGQAPKEKSSHTKLSIKNKGKKRKRVFITG